MKYLIVLIISAVLFGCAGATYNPPKLHGSKSLKQDIGRCYEAEFPMPITILKSEMVDGNMNEPVTWEKTQLKYANTYVNIMHGKVEMSGFRRKFRTYIEKKDNENVLLSSSEANKNSQPHYEIDLYTNKKNQHYIRSYLVGYSKDDKNILHIYMFKKLKQFETPATAKDTKTYAAMIKETKYVYDRMVAGCY